MSQPLIITGMHRSGTSLLASFLQVLGVNIGENLYEADAFNVRGYFEDVDFLEFQRGVLQKCCRCDDGGWIDWGWTESESLNREKFYEYVEDAKRLIASRDESLSFWGWKDPRTSLMLDFWQGLLPDARYLLVYRFPWDVADSILRLNADIFNEHPDYPLRAWAFYNRNILDFYSRFSERCILVNINSLLEAPEVLVKLLETKLKLKITTSTDSQKLGQLYDGNLFKSLGDSHPVVGILRQVAPQYFALLAELDMVADIPSAFSVGNFGGESLPAEGLVMLLHRQFLDSQRQIKNFSQQQEEKNQELQDLQKEISAIKMSKSWKVSQGLSKLKKMLPLQGYNN
ncbi:sulfotransferase [Ancylothrix sp. C2]|uniref:sulfotransferase family protein n=1 Tax=Ancylothrix sp. D3o TaxID=2953691 RepID=UPI0021BB4705|nr:sulfotransferase [Ancylothrix sp. D3o]MCT7949158.1 sulfotransferase [Ancylothrix sp. D3o]